MHIVGAACAAAVPLLMLLKYLGSDGDDRSAWKLLERADIVSVIFCVLAVLLLLASLLTGHRRSLGLAAAALMFAVFGLLLTFPLELPAQSDDVSVKIGGYLVTLFSLVAAGAAIYAAELTPAGPGRGALAGAGRGTDPTFTTPIGGGAPAPSGQPQAPAGAGGIAPGWYDDPHGQARLRYYDGQNWTEQTSN
jgi:Protein of unknown function (DUF2510)